MQQKILYVDLNDKPIGAGTRINAWQKGIAHRIVRVILYDKNGNILLQKRSATKIAYPNMWTDSASGHVDEGENYEQAVHREMYEEIGIKADLEFLGTFLLVGHENGVEIPVFNGVFKGVVDRDIKLTLSEDEVAEVKWHSLEKVRAAVAENLSEFTPGFINALEKYY